MATTVVNLRDEGECIFLISHTPGFACTLGEIRNDSRVRPLEIVYRFDGRVP